MSEIIDLLSERSKRIASPSPVATKAQEREEQARGALAGLLSHYRHAPGDHVKVSLEIFRILVWDTDVAKFLGERQLFVGGLMPQYVKILKSELDVLAQKREIQNHPFVAVMGDNGVVFRVDKES